MDSVASFWGEISYIGRTGTGAVKIVIAGREVIVREHDEGLHHVYLTSRQQKFFVVVRPIMAALHEVVAVYGPAKATQRLVLSLREEIAEGRVDASTFSDWGPEYSLPIL